VNILTQFRLIIIHMFWSIKVPPYPPLLIVFSFAITLKVSPHVHVHVWHCARNFRMIYNTCLAQRKHLSCTTKPCTSGSTPALKTTQITTSMHRSTRGNMSEIAAEPEWNHQEDDLLLSLLHMSRSGIRSEMRRPWKDVAVDMNGAALRLGLKTRFFHHEKVRSRWWSKFRQFYAVGTPEESELSLASEAANNLAPLGDILARMGVGSLNGQPLPPPTNRGFELPRLLFPLRDVNPQASRAPECTSQSKSQPENESTNGKRNRNTSGDTNGNPNMIAFADGKGKGVARDPTKSWLF
jgi:hypothetical protein